MSDVPKRQLNAMVLGKNSVAKYEIASVDSSGVALGPLCFLPTTAVVGFYIFVNVVGRVFGCEMVSGRANNERDRS